jgi:hypothetical protein
LTLLHGLEQRALGTRRRAVDFVREHDVGDDRPGTELELALLLVVEVDAGDIGGITSGVNWMRLKLQPIEREIALASVVLPIPGTSSISR